VSSLLEGLLLGVLQLADLFAFGLALGGTASAEPTPVVMVAAHRGGAQLWPENSLLAFRNATALGADYLEFDVHETRDGELVVIHDATLDRTTTGAGPVRARTLAELRTLRLKDRTGTVTGEIVPTLDEVVRLGAEGGRQLLLEIKVDEAGARYPEIEEKVLAILDRHAMAQRVVVMAFEEPTWRRVRQLRPAIRAGALYSGRSLQGQRLDDVLDSCRRAGVAFVGLQHALLTPEVVAQARRVGLTLGAWTVNERNALARVIALGPAIVISDRPDLAKELLGR
jgi:glycerophosphoryl diester phosphodiesterase